MKRRAVFLDRDGVLIEEQSYIKTLDEMNIYPFTSDCIKKLHQAGFLAIVITNQSGVARGYLTEETLKQMNTKLKEEIGVDDIFYCPHYSKGVIAKYSFNCMCRKPNIGMIEKACDKYEIDLSRSYFIGDRKTDIETGKNAGVKTILLRTGYGKADEAVSNFDYACDDLRNAVNICISGLGEKEK